MSTKIRIEEAEVSSMIEKFKSQITSLFGGQKLTIEAKPGRDDKTAVLSFTTKAYCKMCMLVMGYETEVEWHGLCRRVSESLFEVYDILTFPHETSAATVISDEKEYREWVASLDDDTLNNMRYHGHSHVDFGVSPSSVDMKYRRDVVSQFMDGFADDNFYVFSILNKKGCHSAEVYDVQNNRLYSTANKDLDIQLGDQDIDQELTEFLLDAKEKTKRKKVETKPIVKEVSSQKSEYLGRSNSYDRMFEDMFGGYEK